MLSATKISITVHVRQKAFVMLVRTAQHLLPLLSCSVENCFIALKAFYPNVTDLIQVYFPMLEFCWNFIINNYEPSTGA